MAPFESLGMVPHLHFVATMAISLAIYEILASKNGVPWKLRWGLFKVIENRSIQ